MNKTILIEIINYLTDKKENFEIGKEYWERKLNEVRRQDQLLECDKNISHFNSVISELDSMILNLKLSLSLLTKVEKVK